MIDYAAEFRRLTGAQDASGPRRALAASRLTLAPVELPVRAGLGWLGDKLARPDAAKTAAIRTAIDGLYYGDPVGVGDAAKSAGDALTHSGRPQLWDLFTDPRYGELLTNLQRQVELGPLPHQRGQALGTMMHEAQKARKADPKLEDALLRTLFSEDATDAMKLTRGLSTQLTPEGYFRTGTSAPPAAAGFATDVLTSPLRAIPVGSIPKGIQKVARGVRGALETPADEALAKAGIKGPLARAMGDVQPKVLGAVDEVVTAVSPEHQPLVLGGSRGMTRQQWLKFLDDFDEIMKTAHARGQAGYKEFAERLAKVKIPGKDKMIQALDVWERTGKVPAEIADYMDAIRPYAREWERQLARTGAAPLKSIGYHPRGTGVGNPQTPWFAKHRGVPSTIGEAEAMGRIRAHPAQLAAHRTAAGRAADYASVELNRLAESVGNRVVDSIDDLAKAPPAREGFTRVVLNPNAGMPGEIPFVRPEQIAEGVDPLVRSRLPVYEIPTEMVGFAERFAQASSNADWPAWMKIYRGFLSHWKPTQLGPFAGYWNRNLVTEHFWNFLDTPDILSPKYLAIGKKLAIDKGPVTGALGSKGQYPLQWVKDKLMPMLHGQGQLGVEGLEAAASVARSPMQKATRPATWLMEKLVPFYEDYPRAMQLAYWLDHGKAPMQAVRHVHAFHIDYSKLSPFMQKWGKTIDPFITFPVGASKIILRETLNQPAKMRAITALPKAIEAGIEEATGTRAPAAEYVPEFVRGRAPVWGGQTGEGRDRYVPTSDYMPITEPEEMFGRLTDPDAFMARTGPLGTAAGLIANRDWYRRRAIEEVPGERAQLLGMNVPAKVKHGLGVLPYSRALTTLDALNPFDLFGSEEKESWGGLPWGGIKKKYAQPSFPSRLFSLLTGMKVTEGDRDVGRIYYLDKEVKAQREAYERKIRAAEGNPKLQEYYRRLQEELIEKARNAPPLY